ncbi:MAG: hypothetical protein JNL11_05620 [Bdellovibrionaceae bacterium]|nr:hypothetical protein [Pseudobdellovibrionaceae bacterium]
MKKISVLIIAMSITMLISPWAQADCWGSVAYLTKKSNGSIDFGIFPKDSSSCNCNTVSSGAIGNGSRQISIPEANANVKEAYASLLAAMTTNTKIYVFTSGCVGTEVMSYAQ